MFRPTLRLGTSGIYVLILVNRLRALGYYTGPTRQTFNRNIQSDVMRFQRENGLIADGVVGPLTWAALDAATPDARPTLRLGSTGIYVQELQEMLNLLGYYSGPANVVLDTDTQRAIIHFQRDNSLPADGVVGRQTWLALDDAIQALPPEPGRPTLRLGSTGQYVQALQEKLNLLGYYSGDIGQTFDIATQAAVIAFQTAEGLTATGVVNEQTWTAIAAAIEALPTEPDRPTLRPGATGHYVQDLQMMLRLLDYYGGEINAIFDDETELAVIEFQAASGLVADGIVGPRTWAALNAAIAALPPVPPDPPSRTLKLGDTGPAVGELQEDLKTLGFYTGPVNQTFDTLTQQAVITFQVARGLPPTGIVDDATWDEIAKALEEKPPVSPRPVLREGSVGPSVVDLHEMLALLGYYNGEISDTFSAETTAAVKSFQQEHQLVVDGVVGPLTWAALEADVEEFNQQNPVLRVGSTGPAVRRLVNALILLGYYTGAAGNAFTADVQTAVMDFQSAFGLSVDGVVGANTWGALNSALAVLNQPKFALVWSPNPATFTITTDAFKVISPVWYTVQRRADTGALFVNPGRANAAYSQAVHAKGLKVWGTIQSFNANNTRQLVSSDANITSFINQMIVFIVEHELDGLVLDFEYMYVADTDIFSAFVRRVAAELRINARQRQAAFTITICYTQPPSAGDSGNMWSASIDRAETTKICDYASLMLYDEHYPGGAPGPIASIPWVELGLQRTLAEIPDGKALMGVPLYSGDWTSHKNASGNYVLDGVLYYLTMNNVRDTLANGQYTDRTGQTIRVREYTVRPQLAQGVLHYEYIDTSDTLHNVWAETPETLSLKLDLMNKYRLPGAAAWDITFGNAAAWEVVKTKLAD